MKRWLLWGLLACTGLSWGQQKFDGQVLRQRVVSLSKEMGCAATVFRFAEDYFNRLLSATPQDRLWRMAADGVTVEAGRLENLSLVNEQTTLEMAVKDTRGMLYLANGEFPLIRISFPMSYQLIRQKNQKELEKMLVEELREYKASGEKASSGMDRSRMKKTVSGLWVDAGNRYCMDAIHNDRYYVEGPKKQLSQVCSVDYLLESVTNLLLDGNADCRFSLDLNVHLYGFKTDSLQVNLDNWIGYCRESGCELFVGIKHLNARCVQAVVFAVNSYFHYNHVLNVEFPIAVLEKKEGILKADAYVFIPTHNVSGLFEEMNFVGNKH